MQHNHPCRRTVLGAFATALLAGCAASTAPNGTALTTLVAAAHDRGENAGPRRNFHAVPPRVRAGSAAVRHVSAFMHAVTPGTRLAYVSDFNADFVAVFSRGGKLAGAITSGINSPQGMKVDRKHNLWVANTGAANVLEFARGSTTPKATLDDTGEYPVDVAVCPNGTVYVSNIYARGSDGPGNINVYAAGSTTPTSTLTYPQEGDGLFLACDGSGNIYQGMTLATAPSGPGIVVMYPGGQRSGAKPLGSIAPGFPGGIVIDAAGNLLVDDQNAETVTEYTTAGAPTGRAISTGYGLIAGIGATRNAKMIGGADASNAEGEAFAFPQGAYVESYYDEAFTYLGPTGFAYDPDRD